MRSNHRTAPEQFLLIRNLNLTVKILKNTDDGDWQWQRKRHCFDPRPPAGKRWKCYQKLWKDRSNSYDARRLKICLRNNASSYGCDLFLGRLCILKHLKLQRQTKRINAAGLIRNKMDGISSADQVYSLGSSETWKVEAKGKIPLSWMTTRFSGLSPWSVFVDPMVIRVSIPSRTYVLGKNVISLCPTTVKRQESTFPKTTCLPSNHGVGIKVMKNWDPFVSAPKIWEKTTKTNNYQQVPY